MLKLKKASESDKDWAFLVRKEAEYDLVKKYFGWDDDLQASLHNAEWDRTTPTLVIKDEIKVGFFSIEEEDGQLFFRRFFIDREYRGQGIGTWVLRQVINKYSNNIDGIWLAVFHGNVAKKLYLREGFASAKSDNRFEYMHWKPTTM